MLNGQRIVIKLHRRTPALSENTHRNQTSASLPDSHRDPCSVTALRCPAGSRYRVACPGPSERGGTSGGRARECGPPAVGSMTPLPQRWGSSLTSRAPAFPGILRCSLESQTRVPSSGGEKSQFSADPDLWSIRDPTPGTVIPQPHHHCPHYRPHHRHPLRVSLSGLALPWRGASWSAKMEVAAGGRGTKQVNNNRVQGPTAGSLFLPWP